MKKIALTLSAFLLLSPLAADLSIALLANPALTAQAACTDTTFTLVGSIPDQLVATTPTGTTVTLNKAQLTCMSPYDARGLFRRGMKLPPESIKNSVEPSHIDHVSTRTAIGLAAWRIKSKNSELFENGEILLKNRRGHA